MKEEKSKELEENPDYVLVSKKAFEAEMNNKDEQINILMSSVNNLQNQVALLQRQLDLKSKLPSYGVKSNPDSNTSDKASSQEQ